MTREARVKASSTVQLKKAAVCLDSANRDSLSSPVMAEGSGEKKKKTRPYRFPSSFD